MRTRSMVFCHNCVLIFPPQEADAVNMVAESSDGPRSLWCPRCNHKTNDYRRLPSLMACMQTLDFNHDLRVYQTDASRRMNHGGS